MISQALPLPPSSSLPQLRSLHALTEAQLKAALQYLQDIYCPLRLPPGLPESRGCPDTTTDSGYVSEDEVAEISADRDDVLIALRDDKIERDYAVRWLTRFISRAEELSFAEDSISELIDVAAFILASFTDCDDDDCDEALYRNFCFPVSLSASPSGSVELQLKDAPLSGNDHTDVGLQSWGASIVFSGLMCAQPEKLGLTSLSPSSTLMELGAGTGLVSLTLAKLLTLLPIVDPTVIATDYHPAVLENLRANISMDQTPNHAVYTSLQSLNLDWTAPPAALCSTVDILFAADVVYAPEHAAWLRDCAAHLLAPNGLFWLMVTVRINGKFEGISDTVETAFRNDVKTGGRSGRSVMIHEKEEFDKNQSIGRGDESGYILFKIGWASN